MSDTPERFASRLSKWETVFAAVYLPVHILVLPVVFGLPGVASLIADWTAAELNCLYYGIGAVILLAALYGFFRRDFDTFLDHPGVGLGSILGGYGISYLISLGLTLALTAFDLTLESSPNNAAVMEVAAVDFKKMFAVSVCLAPLVEEPLFRGLLFGKLRDRSRAAAYAVSILMFGLYHVWQYAFEDIRYLIYIVSYIPMSYALAWSYDRTESIWAPIGLHALNNAISLEILKLM